MANIKWSGIESRKYGLTARWYVSAYYGNDNDVDGVGLYNASTNTTGHGGPTRPFATADKAKQQITGVIVFDSGHYESSVIASRTYIGDGNVVFYGWIDLNASIYNNIKLINVEFAQTGIIRDSNLYYCEGSIGRKNLYNTIIVESLSVNYIDASRNIENCIFYRCSGAIGVANNVNYNIKNVVFIECNNLTLNMLSDRPIGTIVDYSILIGSVKTSVAINGITTGVTIEDFKADGNYFVKSFSEVDLWGNASGTGASVAQLQELFCNYFSPIYIDTWQEANFHLKTTAPDIIKYGGLNGAYIGAQPVMHWFDSASLWDIYRDAGNTSDLEKDSVSGAIRISGVAESGTFRSIRISLPKPITADPAVFAANLVYNIEGTVKQGVSNQRIDTTVDLQPDNTANQRVVYDFRMATSPNDVDALSAFKNYELDREPTVDASGYSHLDDNFDADTETKQTIQDFMIEFTLRKVVIA